MPIKSQVDRYVISSDSPSATFNLGKRLGKRLGQGNILALIGELGSGKTLFTKGVCAGLSVPERQISSPSYVLVNEYQGKLPIFHMDLYRLEGLGDKFEIGILDYLGRAEAGVMVVEWAEKVLSLLPAEYIKVQINVLAARKRQVILNGFGERSGSLIRELGAQ